MPDVTSVARRTEVTTTNYNILVVITESIIVTEIYIPSVITPRQHFTMSWLLSCAVIFSVVGCVLCVIGLVGNTLSFVVLHKGGCQNVGSYLLKALSLADNLFLAVYMFDDIDSLLTVDMIQMEVYHENVYAILKWMDIKSIYVWPIVHTFNVGSVWMVVLVAGNRYVAICHPLVESRLSIKRNILFQIIIMTFVFNVPRFFEFERVYLYIYLYEGVFYCTFVYAIPLVMLIFFNVHLIHDLRVAQRDRGTMTSHSNLDQNNVTLVMVIIVVVFIVCQTPAMINHILYIFYAPYVSYSECTIYTTFFFTSNLFVILNSSLNFYIYCLFRRQFRQQLGVICSRLCCNSSQPDVMTP